MTSNPKEAANAGYDLPRAEGSLADRLQNLAELLEAKLALPDCDATTILDQLRQINELQKTILGLHGLETEISELQFEEGSKNKVISAADLAAPAVLVGEQVDEPDTELFDSTSKKAEDPPMNSPTREELKAHQTAVDARIGESEAKVDARLANFDSSVKAGFADLQTEFAHVRTEMAKQTAAMEKSVATLGIEIEKSRGDMHKGTADITKWVVGVGLAILTAVVALSKFADKGTAAPAAPQAPIIVYAQPAPIPSVDPGFRLPPAPADSSKQDPGVLPGAPQPRK